MSPDWTQEYLALNGLSFDFPSRFLAKVDMVSSPHGCWLWTGGLARGYGYIKTHHRPVTKCIVASRASWILFVGPIPESQSVLHDCPDSDNRRCIRPDHLWIGSQAANNADTFAKGRSTFGERHAMRKLSFEQVCQIRTMDGTMRQIGALFGISASTVCDIKHYDSWNHPNLTI